MRLSRTAVLLLALPTAWPFLYMIFFMLWMFSSVFMMEMNPPRGKNEMPLDFMILMVLHLGTMMMTFALMIFYIVHLFKTPRVANDKKALWAVVLFLGNMFAMPVYWYLYMWKPLREEEAAAAGTFIDPAQN